jgi:endoribonuclease LACTB2
MPAPEPKRLRDSAAVVLIRGHDSSLETFWVRRSDRVGFQPGFHAFVGGSVDPADAALEILGMAEGAERTLRACAIRETFEETGVLLGMRGGAMPADLDQARSELLAGTASFPDLARRHGFRFDAGDLAFAGRWQTPSFAAVRFDTVFFLSRVPEDQEPVVRVGELASGEWIAPSRALEHWKSGDVAFVAPILHTLIGLAEGEANLAERLALAPERVGQPPRRIEPKWGIVLHPMKTRPLPPSTHTNAYLIGETEMALVDPGSGETGELDALFALIGDLAQDGRRLTTAVVTHHHPDHLAGLRAVRDRFRLRVAAHPLLAEDVRAEVVLNDGDRLPLAAGPAGDWTLEAIHTPGHARDHVCLYHARTRSLFTGDHVIGAPGTVVVDPPDGDMRDYLDSLERLRELGAETLFPGHGSPQGAADRRIAWLIAHRLEREQKVLAALEAEPLPLPALLEVAYADTRRELWPYAERSLLAHLLKLEADGKAERTGQSWKRTKG